MKPLTIKELAEISAKAVELGYGECIVQVSDDEECNGYHELYERKCYKGGAFTYLNEKTHEHETKGTIVFR